MPSLQPGTQMEGSQGREIIMPADERSSPKDRFDALLVELHEMVEQLARQHEQDISTLKRECGGHEAKSDRIVSPVSKQTSPEYPTFSGANAVVQPIKHVLNNSQSYGLISNTRTLTTDEAPHREIGIRMSPEFNEAPVENTRTLTTNELPHSPRGSRMYLESNETPMEKSPKPERRFIIRQVWVADAVQPFRKSTDSAESSLNKSIFGTDVSVYVSGSSKVVLRPSSPILCLWHVLGFLFLAFDSFAVPFEFAFDLTEFEPLELMQLTKFLGNIFWSLDILLTFFTGRITKAGRLEMRPRRIAVPYIKTWFFFDLSVSVLDWVVFYTKRFTHSPTSILRVMRFARLARLFQWSRMSWLTSLLRSCFINLRISSMFLRLLVNLSKPIFLGLVTVHIAACAWHAIGDNNFDDAWIRRFDMGSKSVEYRYSFSMLWTINRMHGAFTASLIGSPLRELVIEGYLVFFSSLFMIAFVTRLWAVVLSYQDLRFNSKLRGIARDYMWRNKLSREMQVRISRFLSASSIGGPQEIVKTEASFLQQLPEQLKHDTLYHAHRKALCCRQFFELMYHEDPRALRDVCSQALSSSCAVKGETMFVEGDACHGMLFLRAGGLLYRSTQTGMTLLHTHSRGWFHAGIEDDAGDSHGSIANTLCEHVLWTFWEHTGTLSALEDSLLLALSATTFSSVIMVHATAYCQARLYAKHYIWSLNHSAHAVSDLSCFKMTQEDLGKELFVGSRLDHFMFISHYKIEAGTEATLMRDQVENIITQDQRHPGHGLHSPVFIDSEDLVDLAELETHVKRSHCLLLLLTPGLLSRPWCLFEIVTACRNEVHIVPVEVQRPGMKYQYPDEKFYLDFACGKHVSNDGIKLLQDEGIELQEVVQALKKVFCKIALPFSPHKTRSVRDAEIRDVLKRS